MSLTINQRALRIALAWVMTLSMAFALSATFAPTQAYAAAADKPCGPGNIFGCKEIGTNTGLSNQKEPREIILGLINVAMGFLGLVAVIVIMYGGFKWMTASGNEEKVEEAKKLIGAGIIGLVILLTAYALVSYIINTVVSKTA